jgi:hypothetical protein
MGVLQVLVMAAARWCGEVRIDDLVDLPHEAVLDAEDGVAPPETVSRAR